MPLAGGVSALGTLVGTPSNPIVINVLQMVSPYVRYVIPTSPGRALVEEIFISPTHKGRKGYPPSLSCRRSEMRVFFATTSEGVDLWVDNLLHIRVLTPYC